MESAIPDHLKCPRSLSKRVGDDYQPLFPSHVARADESLKQVVMGYFGVQWIEDDHRPRAFSELREIVDQFALPEGPQHYDLAQYCDGDGYLNAMAIGYWRAPEGFHSWQASKTVADWWHSGNRLDSGVGYFREILSPRVEQFETLYGFNDRQPGVGAIMGSVSGEIQEHGYWGGMRDRIPLAQTDRMRASGELTRKEGEPSAGGRVVIGGHANVAVIRSGQDWQETEAEERKLYLVEIEPTLRAGMEYLRDDGASVGCYCNRYLTHIDLEGRPMEKSFGLSHWRSLDALERWSQTHPTHVTIFGTMFRVGAAVQKLRLYHEVSVLDSTSQEYEYVNCHPRTGMMRDARTP
jgi:aldoxime dehydratase